MTPTPTPTPATDQGARRPAPAAAARSFWPLRDLPTVAWLAALVAVTAIHPWLDTPRWLLIHLFFLGALTHAVLVWSQHFAAALLRRPADRDRQASRLIGANGGALLVIAGVETGAWVVVLGGAVCLAAAAVSHAWEFVAGLRGALGNRFAPTLRYYVTAAALFLVGITLGTLLARSPEGEWHSRLIVAHAAVNVLGWIGLTMLGTLVTLWPTMLRTRMLDGTLRTAERTLAVLTAGVLIAAAGALAGWAWVAAAGLAVHTVGVALAAWTMVRLARAKRPASFATWSVAAGIAWLLGCLIAWTGTAAGAAVGAGGAAAAMAGVAAGLTDVAPYLAAGTGAQVLLGALSYLLPVQLGRGPASVKAANARVDRGAVFRVATANVMLLLCAAPVPSWVRVIASVVFLAVLLAFVPLAASAARAARAAAHTRTAPPTGQDTTGQDTTGQDTTGPARSTTRAQLAAALVTALAVVIGGVSADPAAAGLAIAGSATGTVAPTGERRVVQVEAHGMVFTPNRIEVPAGTELVIELTNTDPAQIHDLVLASGVSSPRLAPGETATVEAGIVGADTEGWCSIVGHRQAGMTLDIVATGADSPTASPTTEADDVATTGHDTHALADVPGAEVDFAATPGDDFTAFDAALPPLPERPADGSPTVHRHTFEVIEQEMEVAPGVTQELWTFNGQVPGPVLHGRVGDVFEITLVNNGTMGHSIDFHASWLAPDEPMRTIPPGESLVYTFTAHRAGIWMYHCSTVPMSAHIANGMAGAVIIEPDDLPAVDRSYVISQAEYYLGPQGGTVDLEALNAQRPDALVFNGYVNQYVHRPLQARVGERVRFWVLDLGPNRPSSFHVIGAQFDRVWFEGDYLLGSAAAPADGGDGGSQALGLHPAQGGFVELVFPEAGTYPFVTHYMVDAEHGAKGLVTVTP